MFDLCSERLLEGEERFAGRNGHRFVEIWDCGDRRQPIYRAGDLKEKEIASWVDEARSANGPVQSGLRVLLSPKPAGKPSSGKLPFTQSTYSSLSQAWRIPSIFIRAVAQKLSIVTQCSVAPTSALSTPSRTSPPSSPYANHSPTSPHSHQGATAHSFKCEDEKESRISDAARCLLIRGDVDWTWDYTMLLTFDPTTRTTYCIIVGLTATEIDLVHSYLSSPTIASCRELATYPLLLPMILLDLATDDTSSLLKLRIKLLSQIQQQTGMDRFNSLRSSKVSGRTSIGGWGQERQELDLDAVMLRLTCLSDWVAAQRGFVSIQGRVVSVVEQMLEDGMSNEETFNSDKVISMFQERLDFVRESLLAAEQKCQYLERSIGAQVQTIYSLIGQKDNRLNISAASASCQIASDSRRIAILTRRDSTDMRIIAAVTLIFLPGTFIATIFSTGLFDWGHGDPTPNPNAPPSPSDGTNSPMVSSYIWVYFMLTGILTFVVLVAWFFFSFIQNRKMMRQLRLDPEQVISIESMREKDDERDAEMTVVNGKIVGRRTWALREFERWKEEARGSLRWWGRSRKDGSEVVIERSSAPSLSKVAM
ncbi:hypothetical protein CC78DRAFT_612686 [Lojkania enalia]|uniref:Uncharacterized protein n=1 Tax=Lojkania enalia TaxID=147567 RepID=A0A9P4N9R6_9PLEO|nr:hypothetical protein CC78DRAFT_612686 [Didymosphaeria enalia]